MFERHAPYRAIAAYAPDGLWMKPSIQKASAPISLGRTFLVAALKPSMKVVRRHIRREENKRLNPAGFHGYHTILVLECS